MSSTRVTISIQQGSINATTAIRLEFDTQISATGEYTLRSTQYWGDELVFYQHPVSRALMMTQLLRRIEGIGKITVSQHALVIELGQRFIATNPKRKALMSKIKKAVGAVLAAETPWATVYVSQNWSYHFGAPLVGEGKGRLNEVEPGSPHLTDFGRRVIAALQDKGRLKVGSIWKYHLFVRSSTKGDQPREHDRVDTLLQRHLRSHATSINWIGI